MGHQNNSDMVTENERLIAFAKEPVTLDIPIDYIDSVICGQGGDCLNEALQDQPAALKLLNCIIVGYMLQVAAGKHEGKVDRVLQDMSTGLVENTIQAMKELGYQW